MLVCNLAGIWIERTWKTNLEKTWTLLDFVFVTSDGTLRIALSQPPCESFKEEDLKASCVPNVLQEVDLKLGEMKDPTPAKVKFSKRGNPLLMEIDWEKNGHSHVVYMGTDGMFYKLYLHTGSTKEEHLRFSREKYFTSIAKKNPKPLPKGIVVVHAWPKTPSDASAQEPTISDAEGLVYYDVGQVGARSMLVFKPDGTVLCLRGGQGTGGVSFSLSVLGPNVNDGKDQSFTPVAGATISGTMARFDGVEFKQKASLGTRLTDNGIIQSPTIKVGIGRVNGWMQHVEFWYPGIQNYAPVDAKNKKQAYCVHQLGTQIPGNTHVYVYAKKVAEKTGSYICDGNTWKPNTEITIYSGAWQVKFQAIVYFVASVLLANLIVCCFMCKSGDDAKQGLAEKIDIDYIHFN